jgi:hypothetical protein
MSGRAYIRERGMESLTADAVGVIPREGVDWGTVEGRATRLAKRHRGNPWGDWVVIASPEERGGTNYHLIAEVDGAWVRVVLAAGRREGSKDKAQRSGENYRGNKNNKGKSKNTVDVFV